MATRKPLLTLQESTTEALRPCADFQFSLDSSRLIFSRRVLPSKAKELAVLDVKGGKHIENIALKTETDSVRAVNRDGTKFAVWGQLWDVRRKAQIGQLKSINKQKEITFSASEDKVLAQTTDYALQMFDGTTGQTLFTLSGFGGRIASYAFNKDGSSIIATSEDGVVRLFSAQNGVLLQSFAGHDSSLKEAVLTPDGRHLVTCDGKAIRVWRVGDYPPDYILKDQKEPSSIVLSTNGQLLATGSLDGTGSIWNLNAGKKIAPLIGHQGAIYAVAFDASDTHVLTASKDGTAGLWEASSGRLLRRLPGRGAAVYSVAFSPKGELLAAGFADGTIRVWETTTLALKSEIEGPQHDIYRLSFNSDASRIQTGSFNESMVSDVVAAKPLFIVRSRTERDFAYTIDEHKNEKPMELDAALAKMWETGESFAPQNYRDLDIYHTAYVVNLSKRFEIDVENVGNGDVIKLRIKQSSNQIEYKVLRGHTATIQAVALSADETLLVSASSDGTVRLWSMASFNSLGVLQGHQKDPLAVLVTRDGSTVVSSGADNKVRIWHIFGSYGALLTQVCKSLARDLLPSERNALNSAADQIIENKAVSDLDRRPRRCGILGRSLLSGDSPEVSQTAGVARTLNKMWLSLWSQAK